MAFCSDFRISHQPDLPVDGESSECSPLPKSPRPLFDLEKRICHAGEELFLSNSILSGELTSTP